MGLDSLQDGLRTIREHGNVDSTTENVDLSLLAKLARDNLAETKALRGEVADVRTLSLQTVDYMRRMEQRLDARIGGLDARISDLDARVANVDSRIGGLDDRLVGIRDDLEIMLKSELMGRLANFETRMEHLLDQRLASLEKSD
jgi:uncharacterized coiled-coil protein SlyX